MKKLLLVILAALSYFGAIAETVKTKEIDNGGTPDFVTFGGS